MTWKYQFGEVEIGTTYIPDKSYKFIVNVF